MTAKRILKVLAILFLSGAICADAILCRWLEVAGPEWLLTGDRPARLCDQANFVAFFIGFMMFVALLVIVIDLTTSMLIEIE